MKKNIIIILVLIAFIVAVGFAAQYVDLIGIIKRLHGV